MPGNIPNIFIVGTPRSGTTSMARALAEHPDVEIGRLKEPMYHAKDLPSPLSSTDVDAYLELWSGSAGVERRIDASPWYLFSKEASASIARMSPEARIVVQLRDPVEIIGSLHTHHVFAGFERERDFERAVFGSRSPDPKEFRGTVDYLEVVRLTSQLGRFYEHFAEENIVFVDFAKMSSDPEETHRSLLDRLGLRHVPLDTYPHLNRARHSRIPYVNRHFRRSNSKAARNVRKVVAKLNVAPGRPPIGDVQRRRLLDVLIPDIEELEELLRRDLSAWKEVD